MTLELITTNIRTIPVKYLYAVRGGLDEDGCLEKDQSS